MAITLFGSSSATSDFISTSLGVSSSSNSSGSNSIISDYMSIKNGSYYKLLKAYYKSDESDVTSTAKESAQDKKIQSDSLSLQKAAEALEKTDFQTADSATILSVVKNFVDSYNSTLESSSSEDSTKKDVLRNTVWMTNLTSSNERLLSSVGITVKNDNKLVVNESALSSANKGSLELLFKGNLSYSSKVSAKATSIYKAALGTKASGSAYTSNGTSYQGVNTSSMIDSLT